MVQALQGYWVKIPSLGDINKFYLSSQGPNDKLAHNSTEVPSEEAMRLLDFLPEQKGGVTYMGVGASSRVESSGFSGEGL